ncbi:MAG: 3-oxoacyl-ACP synthase [Bacteroidetes bacterium]|nr:3-oxoacyl-ACP synthase [Bacteroidota bacterium]
MDRIITSYSHLHDNKVIVNGRLIFYQENILKFADFVKTVFKQEQIVYPRFYKMDAISKLGFLAVELVLKEQTIDGYDRDTVGVVLCNSSSSLETDIAHNDTIKDRTAYFPSPSVFVYTLPNIVIGEVCIKNKIKGENAFLISESFNGRLLCDYVDELFNSKRVDACLCGWVEVLGNNCNALMVLVENQDDEKVNKSPGFNPVIFNEENLNFIMKHN